MARALTVIWFHLFLIVLSSAPGDAYTETGRETSRTPYDTKYRKVETYLSFAREIQSDNSTPSYCSQLSRIQRYLTMAQHFRFQIEDTCRSGVQEDHWQLPDETERLGTGDCEDLAIWLYCHLLKEGINNIRLTLGLAGAQGNKAMHAWVTWCKRGKMYILDPSRREGMYAMDQSGPIMYQPCYSYCLDKKWHHE
jgi:predicted transglutaminase-like cysteine proteinase